MNLCLTTAVALVSSLTVSLTSLRAQEVPPQEQRAEWKELTALNFAEWQIQRFIGWSEPAEGGSKRFSFESASGEKFEILAAERRYWLPQEVQSNKQAFLLIREGRYYHIRHRSKEEQQIIKMLKTASATLKGSERSDPKYLSILVERLEDRIQMVAMGKAY